MIRRLERRKTSRSKVGLIGLLGVLAIFGFLIWRFNPLVIKSVIVEGSNLSCLTGFSENELGLKGQNILFINADGLKKKLTAKYFCIKDLTITRESLNSVKVTFLGRVPLVYLSAMESSVSLDLKEATPSSATALLDWDFVKAGQNSNLAADSDGWIFKQENPLNLPLLFLTDQQVQSGKQIKGGILNDIAIVMAKLPGLGIETNNLKMEVTGEDLLVGTTPKLAVSLKKDILRQLIPLQLILQKAKIDEKVPDIVDLRFDKPVIRFVLKK